MELKIWEAYKQWIEFSRMKYKPILWIMLALVATIAVFVVVQILSMLLIQGVTLLPVAFSMATFVLMLGYPYLKSESIIGSIEKNFSDALKQMADTLKAGDTYESALREVADADYGRLSEEMQLALRRLEDGENLDNALQEFAERIDSKIIKRTITIILDSIKTGASLADILDDIAEDVRDFERLKEERKSNTTMQFLFLLFSGGMIAPIIFGEINAVVAGFANIGAQTLDPAQISNALETNNFIVLLIQLYIIIEVLGSGIMMSLTREGKLNKSIIYIPILLLIAFVFYYLSVIVIKGILMGATA
ncbi:MAG: type II secretion system F family protein [archaeon]